MRILCVFVLSAAAALAQTDINVSDRGPYRDLVRGAAFGSSGIGGANNNWIFTPSTPDAGVCLYLRNNNPSNAHAVAVAAYQTADRRITNYIGASSGWIAATLLLPPVTIPSLTTVSTFVQATAAARIVISISGTSTQAGNPDTLDAFTAETTKGGCGSVYGGAAPSIAYLPTLCGTTPFGVNMQVAGTGLSSLTNVNTCVFGLYCNNASASPSTIYLQDGSGTPVVGLSGGSGFSIPALSNLNIPLWGIRFNGGIKWQASASAVVCGISGVQ